MSTLAFSFDIIKITSTGENPQHLFCPDTDDTWCKFRKTEKEGRELRHKKELAGEVMKAVEPAYDRHTNLDILKFWLHPGQFRGTKSSHSVKVP